MQGKECIKTASETGWHKSDYNLISKIPGTDKIGVANLFRGSFAVSNSMELYLLSVFETLDEDHPILDRFKRLGWIVDFDEYEELVKMASPGLTGRGPISLTVCVTQACNFDCNYCFEHHKGERMPENVQHGVVDLAKRMLEVSGSKELLIKWFGGEPLLAPDIIDNMSGEFIQMTESLGVEYHAVINTNGYLFTQDIIDMLYRNKIDLAIVTLDGVGEVHDRARKTKDGGRTFDKIDENLRKLKYPFDISIRHMVHSGSSDQMDTVQEYIKDVVKHSGNRLFYGPDYVYPMYAPDKRPGQLDFADEDAACRVGIIRDIENMNGLNGHYYCGSTSLTVINISASGALYMCTTILDLPEYAFGRIGEWDPADPFGTASDPDNLRMYYNAGIWGNNDEECRKCTWLPLCVGGCPRMRIFFDKECAHYKDHPEKVILHLYNRLKKSKCIN